MLSFRWKLAQFPLRWFTLIFWENMKTFLLTHSLVQLKCWDLKAFSSSWMDMNGDSCYTFIAFILASYKEGKKLLISGLEFPFNSNWDFPTEHDCENSFLTILILFLFGNWMKRKHHAMWKLDLDSIVFVRCSVFVLSGQLELEDFSPQKQFKFLSLQCSKRLTKKTRTKMSSNIVLCIPCRNKS